MSIGELIVWLIVGGLAGTLTGRIVTRSKEGLGWWANLGLGMAGAVVGGFLFNLFNIDLGLGELKVTFEDLIAAVCGSFICILLWHVIQKSRARNNKAES